LAKVISRPAHSRTWLTDPGMPLSASVCTVWMESMATTSGASRCASPRIRSRLVSA
jgi:hypothetical protein